MTGKLIIFSAPSGSGKSTIINYLLTQNLNLTFSATRRPVKIGRQNPQYYEVTEGLSSGEKVIKIGRASCRERV